MIEYDMNMNIINDTSSTTLDRRKSTTFTFVLGVWQAVLPGMSRSQPVPVMCVRDLWLGCDVWVCGCVCAIPACPRMHAEHDVMLRLAVCYAAAQRQRNEQDGEGGEGGGRGEHEAARIICICICICIFKIV